MKIYKVKYLMDDMYEWGEKYYKTIERAVEEAKKLIPTICSIFELYDVNLEDAYEELEKYWQFGDELYIEDIKVED